MFQVRFHGRGGQGAVTAAELLSVAAFLEGKFAQAFPSFGSERMGAPVTSFCRIDTREIRLREPVIEADAVVVQDPTLLHAVEVFQGLAAHGYVLLNTSKSLHFLGLGDLLDKLPPGHVRAVAATELARQHLGRPLPNAALLGAFAALTGAVALAPVLRAIRERFAGALGEANAAAASAAFEAIREVPPC
jgi:pyruvate ferredoxin oxidoreductase gamma subunit